MVVAYGFPLLLIVILIVFAAGKIRPAINGLISWKRSASIAVVYLVLLTLLIPLLYLLPEKGFLKSVDNINQEPQSFNINPQELGLQANFDQQPGLYKNSSQSFSFDSKSLGFLNSNNNYQVFVKKKAIDDGKIDVATYVGNHRAGKIDFTKMIEPPAVSLENGILSIQSGGQQKMNFKQFTPEFTINQFKPDSGINNNMSSAFGWEIVYVSVPKSVEIETGNNVQVLQ